jgi:hypothetical protein
MRIISSLRSLLFTIVVLAISAAAFGQVGIAITFAPPAIPVYEQPLCPAEGYIWTPGYWAYDYDDDDYYWVPGTWVLVPEVGFYWTPGYWAWVNESFVFYDGYWGPHVGFYGGIVYGFGYFGEGYEGGRWENGQFYYNRAVNNVNITNIRNVYNTTVINNTTTINRVSYNGGPGGTNARPRPAEEAAAHERHIPPLPVQTQHAQAARTNPQQRASVNHGKPEVAATPKPGAIRGPGVVPAKAPGAPYNPPANRAANRPRANPPATNREGGIPRTGTPIHPNDLPPRERPAPPNTGNSKMDQKYQQQQEKLYTKQEQERQKLQQRQEQDHQRMAQRQADEARRAQVEQQHQRQTQQLEQRHVEQQQHLQERQQPPSRNQPKPPPR